MNPVYEKVFQRDNYKCRHCGNRNGIHPHHVTFKSQQGEDRLNNLITLCWKCHLEGIHRRKLLIEVLQILENDVVVRFTRVGKWKP